MISLLAVRTEKYQWRGGSLERAPDCLNRNRKLSAPDDRAVAHRIGIPFGRDQQYLGIRADAEQLLLSGEIGQQAEGGKQSGADCTAFP